jgi:hypothetical protein
LFDEVDGVFAKKADANAEDIRRVLNSGYARGKRVWRCDGPKNELRPFEVYGPRFLLVSARFQARWRTGRYPSR